MTFEGLQPKDLRPERLQLLERTKSVAQFVVADLNKPELSQVDHQHLSRVLRVRNGEHVVATDGVGSWRMCTWVDPELLVETETQFQPKPHPEITIGFSLLKGDKPEWVVQKLTEIGVDVIKPFVSDHTVVRWDEKKLQRNHQRLCRIAYEAAMQSRRVWLPEVVEITKLSTTEYTSDSVAIADVDGQELSLQTPTVLIGPEGGWSQQELGNVTQKVHLGATILRAETASLVAATLLCVLRSK